jgi:hypothetical protein
MNEITDNITFNTEQKQNPSDWFLGNDARQNTVGF